MNAIPNRVIRRPAYINRNIHSYYQWTRDNEPKLAEYYNALESFASTECEDFTEFCMIQFDIESELEFERKREPDYPCYICGAESAHEIQYRNDWLDVCDECDARNRRQSDAARARWAEYESNSGEIRG